MAPARDQAIPAGAARLSPGDDIAAAVDEHGPGVTIHLAAGVYRGQSVQAPDGASFLGEAGAALDGEGVVEQAIHGSGRDVTIRGLTITGYANPDQQGALDCTEDVDGKEVLGDGWLVEDVVVTRNRGAGVDVCDRMRLLRSTVSYDGQIGSRAPARASWSRTTRHDNEISGDGASGVAQDDGDVGVFDRVRFSGNTFTGPHEWHRGDEVLDWAGWQAAGNDVTGTYRATPGGR